MVKPLQLVAVVANIISFVSSTVSTSSSSASSSSSSFSTSQSGSDAQLAHDHHEAPSHGHQHKACTVCKGLNEIYDPCPPPCPPQRCDVDIALILCGVSPKVGDPECQPGCRCIDNHVRNQTGVCIPRDQCPTCPNPNEVYDPCIPPCPPRRCDVDERLIKCAAPPQPGDASCKAGCRCADGYYTNSLGVCVTKDQCPPICNGQYEVYNECIQGQCSPKNCSQLGFPVACPRIDPKFCIKGCLCIEDYVRDENDVCIPKKECPSCGGDSNAVAGCGNCKKRCSDIGKEPVFCTEICFENECDCRDGLYFDDNTKKCVLPEQCTPTCGPDEIYDECVQGHCNPKNCSQLGFPIACAEIDPKYCKKGCLCKQGYLRNDEGVCIPIEQCPSCGGDPNAEPGCGSYCGNTCSDYNKKNIACPLSCILNGCQCRKGYVYDSNTKKCVHPNDCTPNCKKNEVYSDCFNKPCPVQNCSLVGVTVICVDLDPKDCIKGCLCKSPLMRENDGSCVPIGDCKRKCMGPHEFYSCGGACDNVCTTLHEQNQTNCPIINIKCNEMCYCEKDYARAKNGTCIPIDQCKTDTCTGKHEIYENCTNPSCSPKKCSEIGFSLNCTDPPTCNKGCICDNGYVKDYKGNCIPINQCPSCGGDPNAHSGCGINCGKNCEDIGKEPGACILLCKVNACDCNDGYYYDNQQKKCVLPSECTNICTGNHEVYENCTNPSCRPKKCSEVGFSLNCTNPPACIKGCVCDNGYVRDYKGNCIPINQCPSCGGDPNAHSGCGINCGTQCEDIGKEPGACIALCKDNACDCNDGHYFNKLQNKCVLPSECPNTSICTGKNEVYENCTNPSCRPQKCSEVGFSLNCTDPPTCNKGCICDNGYVRDYKGLCIPINQCPSCGGDTNAHSGCGINCGKKCEDIGKGPGVCNALCKDNACDCNDGYYFNKLQNKCVLPSECTNTSICTGKNEVYENCTNPSCRPQKCSEVGFSLNCTDPPTCNKGCICDNGYVRDYKGLCIPINQCPSCGGDTNAHSGCGINCGKKCEDIGKEPGACILLCKINACDCNDGYYYDNQQKKCVLPSGCTNTSICTGKNEVYENCTNPSCRPQKCSEVGFSLNCTDPPTCNKGCICDNGYVRDHKGNCIPIKQCPSCGGDQNAESGCGVNCLAKCYDLQHPGKPRPCPRICQINSCDCKKGFYYDETTKTCVRAEDCTQTCGENEVYDSCNNGGCGYRNCSQINGPLLCIDPIKCVGGCTCKEGHLRLDDTGVCVPEKQCPTSCGGDYNAEPGCGLNCNKQCESVGKKGICPRIACPPNGCECKDGYYFNKDMKKCVTPDKCPSCGGDYNAEPGCGLNCNKQCESVGKKGICPRIACPPNGCECKDGYYFSKDMKKCVTPDKCPSSKTENKPNPSQPCN